MKNKYSIQEGLLKLDLIKLMMNYDSSKTLSENKSLITKQEVLKPILLESYIDLRTAPCIPQGSVSQSGGYDPKTNTTYVYFNVGNLGKPLIGNQNDWKIRLGSDGKFSVKDRLNNIKVGNWRCNGAPDIDYVNRPAFIDSETTKLLQSVSLYPNKNIQFYADRIYYQGQTQQNIEFSFQSFMTNKTNSAPSPYGENVGYLIPKTKPQPPTKYTGGFIKKPGTPTPKDPWIYNGKIYNSNEDAQNQYTSDLKFWALANDPKLYSEITRTSKSGKKVKKEGIHPSEYDEYLEKVNALRREKEALLSKYKVYGPTGQGYDYNKISTEDYINQKKIDAKLAQLEKEYVRKDFRKGITKEDYEQYKTLKTAIEKYYTPLIAEACRTKIDPNQKFYPEVNLTGGSDYLGKGGGAEKDIRRSQGLEEPKREPSKCERLKAELTYKLKTLDEYYQKTGPDKRSTFDKIWDEWGVFIQLGSAIGLTLLLSAVGVGPIGIIIGDAILNGATAAYQFSRGEYADAGVSLIFAVLPTALLKAGALQVPKAVNQSIIKKLGETTIKNPGDLQQFMLLKLTEEERKWFKFFTEQNKALIEKEAKNVTKQILNKATKQGLEVDPKAIKQFQKNWAKGEVKAVEAKVGKLKVNPVKNPNLQQVGIAGVGFKVDIILRELQKAKDKKLSDIQQERIKVFFETMPKEVTQIYKELITNNQLNAVLAGATPETISKITGDNLKALLPRKINPKTKKPYTDEEISLLIQKQVPIATKRLSEERPDLFDEKINIDQKGKITDEKASKISAVAAAENNKEEFLLNDDKIDKTQFETNMKNKTPGVYYYFGFDKNIIDIIQLNGGNLITDDTYKLTIS